MRVIDCDWNKRNGNGQSTCHLCNKLTWDSWCYDFELKILDKELFHTVLCGDCISKIKQKMECKISPCEETIEENKDIEKIGYLKYCENEVESILHRKIDELVEEVNKLKGKYE